MKILITTPSLKLLGGVANHYLGLKEFWHEKVKYLTVGNRGGKGGNGKFIIIWDCLKILWQLLFFHPDVVLLNPSIGKNALRRDFLFQKIINSLGFKTVIFIHGFDIKTFEELNHRWLAENLNKASVIIVLAKAFRIKLQDIRVKVPIKLLTTKVDDNLIMDFDITKKDYSKQSLLFVARVEKVKGINQTLDIFKLLKEKFPILTLNIVGDGSELINIKKRIEDEKIEGIKISGRLNGKDLVKAFEEADILVFPTYHGEGMPTTVLEAMAFGLVIITRPVGGIADFFENDKMGFISDSLEPQVFANGIEQLLEIPEKMKEIGQFNHKYALSHFMASKVATQIETLLKELK